MTLAQQTTKKITLNRMAINFIDLDKDKAKIAGEVFPIIQGNSTIYSFFETHFMSTRSGKNTKSCKFNVTDATMMTKTNRYFKINTDQEFITLSKEVTENLFNIMKNSSSNSNGTLIIIDVNYNGEDCIFLIKLDPKDGVKIDKEKLTIEVLEDILPDSNDNVHKCAIIRHTKINSVETDLFVMDKQQKEGEPAKYFLQTFLQAEEIGNDKKIVRVAMKLTKDKLLLDEIDVEEYEIDELIDSQFSNGSILQVHTVYENILKSKVDPQMIDRELFIKSKVDHFVKEFIHCNPESQTSFKVERKDSVAIYKASQNQVYFKFNKGISSKVKVNYDQEGNTIINIDKSLNFKKIVK